MAPEWVKEVARSYDHTPWVQDITTQLAIHAVESSGYTISNGLVRFKGRLVIGDAEALKGRVIVFLHGSAVGGRSGIQAIYQKVRQLFFWLGKKKAVVSFLLSPEVCQRCKHENMAYLDLL